MKKTLAATLFLAILCSAAAMQAQEVAELYEIRQMADTVTTYMAYVGEHTLLTMSTHTNEAFELEYILQKMDDDGTVLATRRVWDDNIVHQYVTQVVSEIYTCEDEDPFFFFIRRPVDSDTNTFHKATIHEDLSLSYFDYSWYGVDFSTLLGGMANYTAVNVTINKDGAVVLSYNTTPQQSEQRIRIVRFDADGEVLAETLFDNPYGDESRHAIVTTPDSLGFRIIRMSNHPHVRTLWCDCYTFDTDLRIADTMVNVDQYSYPYLCSDMAYFRVNPYSGWNYSITKISFPAYNGHPEVEQDIIMSVYDEDMTQRNYSWGLTTPDIDHGGYKYTIDFGSADDIYMVGMMDGAAPRNVYVAYVDREVNKKGELYFVHPERITRPWCVTACPDGGCLMACMGYVLATGIYENSIYRITISDFLDVEEAHSHGFAVATVYPNPGNGVLNIRTAMQDAQVEVYDLNGRLIHKQDITENITAINAESWLSGVYVWKVLANGREAESGKWVKE